MKTAELMETEKKSAGGENTIHLPLGLLGFELVKKYALLANPEEDPFIWLQMLEGGRKSFLMVSPFLVLPDYKPDVSTADVEFLNLTDPSDALVFNICTVRGPGRATINLKGPIIINRHTLIGKQVIPNNANEYDLCYPLPVS